MSKVYKLSFVAPAGVAAVARQALADRRIYGHGGTAVGVARAVQLSSGRPCSLQTLKRMRSFFARHGPDDRSQASSAASIAWRLWGGYEGKRWCEIILRRQGY
jgi:hypothetical protein